MPLSPIESPVQMFARLGVPLPATSLLTALFLFAFIIWAAYSLIALYHWLKYSHASSVAIPALIAHFAISLGILSYALTGVVPLI